MRKGTSLLQGGFSLIELVIVVILLTISLTLAAPSFQDTIERQRLNGLGDNLHFLFKLAKSQAAKQNTMIYAVYQIDSQNSQQWCVGLSDSDPKCNCNLADSCLVENNQRIINSAAYHQVSLDSLTGNPVSIRPDRGRSTASTVNFSLHNKDIRLIRATMGRDRICSPTNTSLRYPVCP